MENQKLDNQLNLALNATNEEREKSLDLDVGYEKKDAIWELIVKHNGNLDRLKALNIQIFELLNNYAILRVAQDLINTLAEYEEIIYIEKPKRLQFTIRQGIRSSCISPLQTMTQNSLRLFGHGVIIAVIDSGIDYRHVAFIDDNKTRIFEIWDQSVDTIYTEEQINRAIRDNVPLNPATTDVSGHGTAVASIASGVAPESRLLVVKLGRTLPNSFPRTSELMRAIDYCVRRAVEVNLPVVINLSFGNNYGSHEGDSLLETYINLASQVGRTTIIAGTGNEAASAIHSSITLNDEVRVIELLIERYESSINLQLWKNYVDEFDIELIAPSGESTGNINRTLGTARYTVDNTEVLLYYGEPSPYSKSQEIYFDFLPRDSYLTQGIWQLVITPERIADGRIDLWLPSNASLNGTAFLRPTPDNTITIPSTSEMVISVGAYNAYNDSVADFSGRGESIGVYRNKPDLVAPGVNIRCASPGGGYVIRSGTSMAAPFVSGAAALLCDYGITKGNDRYLYGEKIKAYLSYGARALPGYERIPNEITGFGALCVADSIPK